MYEPNFKNTTKLQDSLKEIEDIRDLLRTIPILPIVEERIRHQALVETVYYTAKIEGNPLDIQAVERLAPNQIPKSKIDSDEQTHINLYEVMNFIRYIAGQADIPIDGKVIKQIHTYVVRDIPKEGLPGIYKTRSNAIEDYATKERIFLPPSPNDTPRLMSELSAWLSQRPLAFHPIIAAGIAHLELVAIHPFDNGNGRTARALADLVLYRYGYTFRHLFSWVRQVGIDMGTYHQKLRQVLGNQYGANTDPTIWVEYFAESVARTLTQKKPELLRIGESFVNAYKLGAERGLSPDQVEAIVFAASYGNVTTGEYMRAKKLARSTVVKRLNQLVEAGIMYTEGKGRGVRYVLTSDEIVSTKAPQTEGIQLALETIKGQIK